MLGKTWGKGKTDSPGGSLRGGYLWLHFIHLAVNRIVVNRPSERWKHHEWRLFERGRFSVLSSFSPAVYHGVCQRFLVIFHHKFFPAADHQVSFRF